MAKELEQYPENGILQDKPIKYATKETIDCLVKAIRSNDSITKEDIIGILEKLAEELVSVDRLITNICEATLQVINEGRVAE